ncbi:MAG: hypothetical protein K2Q09_06220 [Phycisphaerales bacterium]|nr:hypothetical protein [Phycisphaerales bacterium]
MNWPLTLASPGPWRPFLDPLVIDSFWYLLIIPIAFFIAVGYKAVRVKTLKGFWTAVLVMTVQTVLGMIALAVAFYLLVQVWPKVFGDG